MTALAALTFALPAWAAPATVRVPADAAPSAAFVTQYCVTCHSQRAKTGGLVLEHLDPATPAAQAELWEEVARKLRAGLMPPSGARRPPDTETTAFTAALEAALDRHAGLHPNPGRTPALHRLNRAEYRNAVRDLLAVDVHVASLLPPDDASFGFDTIASALRIDATRMEQYLSAATVVSRAALGSVTGDPAPREYTVPEELGQSDRREGLPSAPAAA